MTEIQDGSKVARCESEPPSDEQLVRDALKRLNPEFHKLNSAWGALDRIMAKPRLCAKCGGWIVLVAGVWTHTETLAAPHAPVLPTDAGQQKEKHERS